MIPGSSRATIVRALTIRPTIAPFFLTNHTGISYVFSKIDSRQTALYLTFPILSGITSAGNASMLPREIGQPIGKLLTY